MDIYVVLDGSRVIGASTRLQGAEELRADYIARESNLVRAGWPAPEKVAAALWQRTTVVNTELRED